MTNNTAKPARILGLLKLFWLALAGGLFINGCTSPPSVTLPQLSQDRIKAYKTVRIYANRSMNTETDITVAKGDLYSLVITGKIGTNRWNKKQLGYDGVGPDGKLWVLINEEYQIVPPINSTIDAQEEGPIQLRVFDDRRNYKDNTGSFDVTIIVWNTKDIDYIVDFFKQLADLNPEIEAAKKTYAQTKSFQEYRSKSILAADKTSTQVTKQSDAPASTQEVKNAPDVKPIDPAVAAATIKESEPRLPIVADSGQAQQTQDLHPPLMLIVSPRENQVISSITIQLIGVIEDDEGLQKIEILINGTPLDLKNKRGLSINQAQPAKRFEFNENIGVIEGRTDIRIRAQDINGRLTEKSITVNREKKRTKVWAVIVGIDTYPNLPHLKYAVKDAQAFYDLLLENNFASPEHVFLVTDSQADLNSLRSVLGTKLKQKASKDDMVLIYFAGHGATEKDASSPDGDGLEKYLLPYDANPDDLYATALPMREISHILNRIRSDRLVFIADACYSGASGGRTVRLDDIRAHLSDAYLDRIAGGKGRVIMTASGPNEVSAEDVSLGHGVFTYYLIEAIKGKADYDVDGMISVDEAYRYVSEEVPKFTGQEQHPVKKGSVEGQLILGIID